MPGPSAPLAAGSLSRRELLRRSGLVLIAASSGGVLASACDVAGDPGDEQAPQDTLGVRTVMDIQNLDPAFMVSTVDDAVMLCVAENLVTFLPGSTELSNELAAELKSSEDGLTHEFRLKEGIPFQGGFGEVTAEDVKFSFERIAGLTDPKLDSPYQGDWATLKEVEVTGKYTGVIRLSKPFPPLFLTTLPGHAGMIISRKAYEERGEDFATNPVGSGPYEFVEWKRGQRVVLRRFADWGGAATEWAEEPQWKEIGFEPITDDSAANIAVETGEVDFGPVAHASVERFRNDDNFAVTKQTTLDYGWVGFNVRDEDLSDVNVRRAIRRALDVDSMIAAAFEGKTTRANTLIAPDMPIGHWGEAPQYQRDTEEAKALLEKAGVDKLNLEMSIAEEPGARAIAAIVQANLKDIGITVKIRLRAEGEMKEQVKSLQLFYVSFSNQADPSWATVWFISDQIGEWNYMSWSNEEYDSLHEAALVETDQSRRDEMYVRMQQLMDEDAVAAWVMYRTHHYAHVPELEPSLVTPRYGKYRAWDIRA
jgi:peptide/nickel transport system substrate-binding protein